MTYVISVGGDPVNPNPYTYSQISMTTNIALVWPSNNQDATYTATDWVDITASVGSLIVTMPDATEAGTGTEVVFNNYGAQTIIINNSAGGNITTSTAGTAIRIWITDNSTAAGIWRVANIGSGTTAAVASMLAGYGLVAQAGILSQTMLPLSYSTDFTLNAGHRAALVRWTGGAGTATLGNPATLGAGWFTNINNSGTGILVLNGNGATIDSSATTNIALKQGFIIETDGVNFYTIGNPVTNASGFTLLTKSVAGAADVTLSSSESAYSIIYFTGILTASINVIVPAAVNEWIMYNNTTGAYTLTVKTAFGIGVAITQGTRRILNCDGTDVNYSDSVGTGTVTSVTAGTGLTGGGTTAVTLAISNTAVNAGTYGSSSRGVTYTVNAQGQITNSTDFPLNISSFTGTLAVANGGTGLTTLTANNVILGNGGSSPSFVAPGSANNVLVSTGSSWSSTTIPAAVKSDQVSASSTSLAVVPAVQQYHPSAAKVWGHFSVSGTGITLNASYGVTSMTYNSVGSYTINFSTSFTSANYSAYFNGRNGALNTYSYIATGRSSGAFTSQIINLSSQVAADVTEGDFACWGTQ